MEISYIYSIPYILLMIFYISLANYQLIYNDEVNLEKVRKACVLAFLLFFGLRGFIGYDYNTYFPMFQDIEFGSSIFSSDLNEFMEPGFIYYMSFIRMLTSNYHVFIFISVIIDVVFLNIIIKRYSLNYALSFAFFLAFNLALEVDLLSNIKSLFIFLIALKYISERKALKYYLTIFVALIFHWTAVIYIPLYFFLHKKLARNAIIIILIIGNIIFLTQAVSLVAIFSNFLGLLGGIFATKNDAYVNSDLFSASWGFSIGYIERLTTTLMILIYYNKIIERNKNNIMFINLFVIYFSLFLYFSDLHILVQYLTLHVILQIL